MNVPKRYSPYLVTLHWLVAVLVILNLIMGGYMADDIPNTSPEKIGALRNHMIIGGIILILMIIRVFVRIRTPKPPPATTGNATLDKIGVGTQLMLYVLVFLMVITGIATSAMAGLPAIVFGHSGAALPEDFSVYPPRILHGITGALLGLTILLHASAALYHQFILKDHLLSRMWYGKK